MARKTGTRTTTRRLFAATRERYLRRLGWLRSPRRSWPGYGSARRAIWPGADKSGAAYPGRPSSDHAARAPRLPISNSPATNGCRRRGTPTITRLIAGPSVACEIHGAPTSSLRSCRTGKQKAAKIESSLSIVPENSSEEIAGTVSDSRRDCLVAAPALGAHASKQRSKAANARPGQGGPVDFRTRCSARASLARAGIARLVGSRSRHTAL